ncbi:hypothetical protein GCM10025881_17370 [Pseudolysinimonas kribbensis]|uniref:ROK family protein n=1 Tax=Pseudolysinimonas kribbensis TaxID=433641 RepID=A0ABQ6K386_9MICO|nr:ROK family protein [Pseudolysinimonas kribbensis]GMA94913.1 hypothetical protein GCM10025881_17370 [Pseudolysinimonas kribbensis]
MTEINSTPVRTVGRPARSFGFRYGAAHLVALQLEAGQIQATVADLAAEVLGERRMTLPIATSRHERLALLDRCVAGLLGAAGVERSSVVAVTVSTPGIVQDDGTIDLPMTMPDWTGFSLSDAVGQLFDCPVRVENDAKLAALGEKWSRDGEVRDFVYVFADEARIGIGLVVQNELYRGRDGGAGEITWAPSWGCTPCRARRWTASTMRTPPPTRPPRRSSTRPARARPKRSRRSGRSPKLWCPRSRRSRG